VSSDHNRYPQQGAVMGLVSLTRDFIVSSLTAGIERLVEEVKIERALSQAEESVGSRKEATIIPVSTYTCDVSGQRTEHFLEERKVWEGW